MKVRFDVPASPATLTAALEGITAVDCVMMNEAIKAGTPFPRLRDGRVRYVRDPQRGDGVEHWKFVDQVYRDGYGDCEDLAPMLAAEFRVYEGLCAIAIVTRSGPKTFHARVRLPDGKILDPSRALGMRKRRA